MIGCSKKNRDPRLFFWRKEKETRINFKHGLIVIDPRITGPRGSDSRHKAKSLDEEMQCQGPRSVKTSLYLSSAFFFLSFFFVISALCFAALNIRYRLDLPLKQTVNFFSFMKAKDHNRTYPKVLLWFPAMAKAVHYIWPKTVVKTSV